ncbi:hypothetical protein ACFVTY_30835 [Streptomyces sp. NPDC058067]|uniref:hypothetical protein n=1 Tax=Streptomyces sp. NPDC058067 TaxID=3346324 RepID=UPI0036F0236C
MWALVYVEDIPAEHVGRVYGIAPILSQGVGGSLSGALFGALFGALLVAHRLPGGELPSEGGFVGFRWLAAGCALVAGLCGAAYVKSYGTGGPRTERTAPVAVRRDSAPTPS